MVRFELTMATKYLLSTTPFKKLRSNRQVEKRGAVKPGICTLSLNCSRVLAPNCDEVSHLYDILNLLISFKIFFGKAAPGVNRDLLISSFLPLLLFFISILSPISPPSIPVHTSL